MKRIWRWVRRDTVFALHDVHLAHHGGMDGVKNEGLIDSALARAQQLDAYGKPPPDAFDLAAAYAFGIIKNHGFHDGNKRTGWVLARLFLLDNGVRLSFKPEDAIQAVLALAAGTMSELEFAAWLREREIKE